MNIPMLTDAQLHAQLEKLNAVADELEATLKDANEAHLIPTRPKPSTDPFRTRDLMIAHIAKLRTASRGIDARAEERERTRLEGVSLPDEAACRKIAEATKLEPLASVIVEAIEKLFAERKKLREVELPKFFPGAGKRERAAHLKELGEALREDGDAEYLQNAHVFTKAELDEELSEKRKIIKQRLKEIDLEIFQLLEARLVKFANSVEALWGELVAEDTKLSASLGLLYAESMPVLQLQKLVRELRKQVDGIKRSSRPLVTPWLLSFVNLKAAA